MSLSASARRGGVQATWTRENVIEKIQRWAALYGEPPRAADLNPSAAKWSNAEWRVNRYRAGDPATGEPWPSLNAVKGLFGGSLNAAIVAAGFEPNRSGPPSRKAVERLDIDREVMSPRARVALAAARAEVGELRERVRVLEGLLARAREARGALVEALGAARRAHRAASARAVPRERARPQAKVKTRVERVRVPDTTAVKRLERKVDRLGERLLAGEAALRAEKDRAGAALRELARVRKRGDAAVVERDEARLEARDAVRAAKGLEDRLVAAEAAAERPRVEIRERVVRSASDREVMDARRAVAEAERAADDAELRAARAERELRELGALVSGEDRRLTAAEVAGLREGGPSGPEVLARALADLTRARRAAPGRVPAALVRVASAAVRWRDAL